MTQSTIAEKNLSEARHKLLDLTMRNKLLNHRPSKNKCIRVVDEIAHDIYDYLVIQQRTMEFLDNPDSEKTDTSDLLFSDTQLSENNKIANEKAKLKISDKYLQTNLLNDVLQKTLFVMFNQAKTVMEEQGYTVLFLALGFLEWKESSEEINIRRSPLILIPVELERNSVRSAYKITWTGDEIYSNISLQAKLSEQNIILPDFEMPEEKHYIDQYFYQIAQSCKNHKDWNVTRDVYLDFFSFTKFVMYKDLDPVLWVDNPPLDNPLLKMLLDPDYDQEKGDGFQEDEIDIKLSAKNTFHIMDADPSQIVVIENVKRNKNLVVEGPPGTGKSQTITNLIADLLAEDKTVLFVSEKMAALEVVKSRLDQTGLGDFCLELHSRKTNKKNVLSELERTFRRPVAAGISEDSKYKDLDDIKKKLNEYAAALKTQVGNLKWTPYKMFSMYEEAVVFSEKKGKEFKYIKIPEPEKISNEDYQSTLFALNEYIDVVEMVVPIETNIWKTTRPVQILPADQQRVKYLIENLQIIIKEIRTQLKTIASESAIMLPESLNEVENVLLPVLNILSELRKISSNILLNKFNESEAFRLILELRQYKTVLDDVKKSFDINRLDKGITSLVDDYKSLSKSLTRFFKPSFYRIRKEIKSLFLKPSSVINKSMNIELGSAVLYQNKREIINFNRELGNSLFGEHWKGVDSDIEQLSGYIAWLKKWVNEYQNALNSKWIFCSYEEVLNKLSQLTISETEASLINSINNLKSYYAELSAILKPSSDMEDVGSVLFNDFEKRLYDWSNNLHRLQTWSRYIVRRNNLDSTCAKELISEIENGKISIDEISVIFKGSLAGSLLDFAFKSYPALSEFLGEIHNKNIKRFSDLDNQTIHINRQRLAHMLSSKRPVMYDGRSEGSEMGILKGEFTRKRGHMPIRKLLAKAGTLILRAKPCFMMSPLSIAQFLTPTSTPFDVIIFDEASQVKPEDALGALLRGKQLVVMGDTKQLPPTSFFDHIADEVDKDDYDKDDMSITDMESILHHCKRSFPVKMLKWHYRSRHESLIAVSNHEFYGNELLIYPSPIEVDKNLGLFFKHIPETVYDRGNSTVNRLEAKAVAKAAIEHYKKNPLKSLGIGTFNIKQQQAVLEEIDLQLKLNPEMEQYFAPKVAEPFFVKNLETIQGDERDFIIISIGYGFDSNRKLSSNFGPLNHEGGERRLNVLITRARECCVIYSNFRYSDLSVSTDSPHGVKSLKTFLEYAETRNIRTFESDREDTDSPFEDSVFDFLTSNGYVVKKQVGCAGFRIDLAIVDEKNPGRYLLAIECDGAKYHNSPVARDRDRLRQQILERLGWSIYRIWSTDWYRNRRITMQALLDHIEKTKIYNVIPVLKEEDKNTDKKNCEILYDKISDSDDNIALIDLIPEYIICNDLRLNTANQIHETSKIHFRSAIESIVNVEGPVHVDEVMRRIRTHWGLKKTGNRIREHLADAINHYTRCSSIVIKNNFLYIQGKPVIIRKRTTGDPLPDIDLICDEEIEAAILFVLRHLFSTKIDSLVIEASRLFGIQVTRAETNHRITEIVYSLQKQKRVVIDEQGIVRSV